MEWVKLLNHFFAIKRKFLRDKFKIRKFRPGLPMKILSFNYIIETIASRSLHFETNLFMRDCKSCKLSGPYTINHLLWYNHWLIELNYSKCTCITFRIVLSAFTRFFNPKKYVYDWIFKLLQICQSFAVCEFSK